MTGRIRKLIMIGAIAVVAAGCGDSSDTPLAATVPSTMAPMTTAATTSTTLAGPDPVLVQDCVAFVQFGAFTGNALLSGMWDAAGADVAILQINCEALDAGTLSGMSAQWQEIQRYIAAANADSSTTTITVAP